MSSDEIINNQQLILGNQARIEENQRKLDEIIGNQQVIQENQAKLNTLLANQEKIQANQATILANQNEILARLKS